MLTPLDFHGGEKRKTEGLIRRGQVHERKIYYRCIRTILQEEEEKNENGLIKSSTLTSLQSGEVPKKD